jgi:hypothetical protein
MQCTITRNALYCQRCGQPLRCKNCQAQLLPTAHACIQCGQLIPERSNSELFDVGIVSVPPGYNRLKFHETYAADVRELDVTISDHAITQIGGYIGDLIPSLMGTRLKGHTNSSANYQQQKQPDLVEVTSEIQSPQPQLPASVPQSASSEHSSEQGIWEIFRNHEGRLTQERLDLKAASKRDYIIRLAFLYIYARWLLNEEKVPRDDVFRILDDAGVKDTNRSRYIYESGIRSDESDTLRLSLEGRTRAQQYILEVLDSQGAEGWLPGPQARPTTSRVKKPNKKSTERHSDTEAIIAEWVSHEGTKALVNAIQHSTIINLSTLDKSLLALYGIYMVGTEQEVPIASIVTYLYDAFEIKVEPSALSTAFYKARKGKTSKTSYVNFREGEGYKITPSGREHVENLLNLKQQQLATVEVNA